MLKNTTQDNAKEIIDTYNQGHFYPTDGRRDISGRSSTPNKDSLVEHILDFLDSYYPAHYGTSPSMHSPMAFSNLSL